MATAALPASAADATPAEAPAPLAVSLPAKPSQLLRAPLATWQPLLQQIGAMLDERASQGGLLGKPALTELSIHRTLLLQTQRSWLDVLAAVEKARSLQDSESGRQTAGLLNEMLALQALQAGDAAWLRKALRDRVLAMPWADVEQTLRSLRGQLASMQADAIEAYVVGKMDLSASMTKNQASLGFVMQLLALRFQLFEVLPQREALVAGLDDAMAQRGGPSPR